MLKLFFILLSIIPINVMLVSHASADIIDEQDLIVDVVRVCGHLKYANFSSARIYLTSDLHTTVEEALPRIRCADSDLIGMILEDMTYDQSKWLRDRIREYFEKEISQPETYSRFLLKGTDGRNIFIRINSVYEKLKNGSREKNLIKRERVLIESHGEFIEYLTKHPVSGSAEVIAEHKLNFK